MGISQRQPYRSLTAGLLLAINLCAPTANAQSGNFYNGKTVRILVGAPAGEELQGQINEILSQPREVIDLVKKVLSD